MVFDRDQPEAIRVLVTRRGRPRPQLVMTWPTIAEAWLYACHMTAAGHVAELRTPAAAATSDTRWREKQRWLPLRA